uniref:Secreted protein n=1 Tax=Heterorhabditis bacteriophora TaxID=37862 RepID=A0A1I7WM61_HETBA
MRNSLAMLICLFIRQLTTLFQINLLVCLKWAVSMFRNGRCTKMLVNVKMCERDRKQFILIMKYDNED